MGSALANVLIMGLVSVWFSSHKRGKAAGFVVIGSGFAIILSGKLVPYLNSISENGWRMSWGVLGSLVLAVAVVCYLVLRDTPQDKGLLPVGSGETVAGRSSSSVTEPVEVCPAVLYHCAALYFLFGFTYVIYVTFVVTSMVQERGFSEAVAGNFWAWVGFLSLFSGPVFGALSDQFGRKAGLITVFCFQTLAYLFVGFDLPDVFLYLSIGCFGIVAWSIPSIMAALVGDLVGPQKAVAVFGFVTFVFGLGQILGPFLAGILAERSGGFFLSFLMAAALAALAVVLSAFLPVGGTRLSR